MTEGREISSSRNFIATSLESPKFADGAGLAGNLQPFLPGESALVRTVYLPEQLPFLLFYMVPDEIFDKEVGDSVVVHGHIELLCIGS